MRRLLGLALLLPLAARANPPGFGVSVLVDGLPRPELGRGGTIYVEALRGQTYALRLSNPLPVRVGVALSVDGLNTIDARHTEAQSARKWVLGPYETVTIPGWQVSGETARAFVFTGERSSYGAFLGDTRNLGVIEAVFFRERLVPPRPAIGRIQENDRRLPDGRFSSKEEEQGEASPTQREAPAAGGSGAPPSRKSLLSPSPPSPSDEYAATGMGGRRDHSVVEVALDLDPSPVAMVRIRYEFRPQLVRLGLLPSDLPDPLRRREEASGFAAYCPEAP